MEQTQFMFFGVSQERENYETNDELEEREGIRDDPKEKSEKSSVLSENLAEIASNKECLVREIEESGGENKLENLESRKENKAVSRIDECEIEEIGDFSKNWAETEPAKEIEKIGGENESENLEIGEEIENGVHEEIGYFSERLEVVSKLDDYKIDNIGDFSEKWAEIGSVKECLVRVIESIDGENNGKMTEGIETEVVGEVGDFSVGIKEVLNLAITVESKLNEYKEVREKEKSDKSRVSLENLVEIKSIKECLNRVIESIVGENSREIKEGVETDPVEEIQDFSVGVKEILKLVRVVESKVSESKEAWEKEKSDKVKVLSNHFQKVKSVKECLVRLLESISEENKAESIVDQNTETEETHTKFGEEYMAFGVETNTISSLVIKMELKLGEYKEMRGKEKRELESSVVSLTEENRDINTLLRVALAEKETVERSLNRLKGNNELKRGTIWGLPRVGFGFMMGTSEQASDNSSVKSDSSECEEEVESLASTVERMMKNLRFEITKLRKSLEESRSDTERLQTLMEKQARTISEHALYIKELEDREEMQTQNIEELLREIKESEEEVSRWREACELEVEAGRSIVEERDKLVFILKQELEKTKAALEIANGKLKLKEDLANAAMAAQAAGERSLQLTDSRVSVLNERVEELTKQLEEAENKVNFRRKVRHFCWPFRVLKVNSRNGGLRNFKRMLPEMQALVQ